MVTGNGNSYQLLYDALGRCAVRILNGAVTYYIYDGEKPILEYGGSYHLNAANIYGRGIDEILRRDDYTVTPTRTLFYQDDHEGSVTHLTDGNGQVIESYRYDAFGKPTVFSSTNQPLNSSTVGNRFLFTGREYVPTFGIYEYRNRAYHPGLGRFMSEDPKGFVRRIGLGKSPDDWSFAKFPGEAEYNLFRYCGNDPIDFEDPMGLDGADPAWLNFKENQLAKAQASRRDGMTVGLVDKVGQQNQLSASDVSKAVKVWNEHKSEKAGGVVKALDTLPENFTVSGDTLRAGIAKSGVKLDETQAKVLANVNAASRIGDRVTITNNGAITVKAIGQVAKTVSLTVRSQPPALQNIQGIAIGIGRFAIPIHEWP